MRVYEPVPVRLSVRVGGLAIVMVMMPMGRRRAQAPPTLCGEDHSHRKHDESRDQAQDWEKPLGYDEARRHQGRKSQRKDTDGVGCRDGEPEKNRVPGRPARADEIRADDRLAMFWRERMQPTEK